MLNKIERIVIKHIEKPASIIQDIMVNTVIRLQVHSKEQLQVMLHVIVKKTHL